MQHNATETYPISDANYYLFNVSYTNLDKIYNIVSELQKFKKFN